jgi:drug/metabolite transporter (DMT)-like permease
VTGASGAERAPPASLGSAAAVGAAFFWGVSAVVAKRFAVADPPIPVERLIAGRTAVAALLLSAWVLVARRGAFRVEPPLRASFLATGAVLGLVMYTYYLAVRDAGVATGILLQYCAPFLVLIHEAVFRRGAVDRRSWVALALVLPGAALASGVSLGAGLEGKALRGAAAGLASAFLFAVFTLRGRTGIARAGYWQFTLHAFLGAAGMGALIAAWGALAQEAGTASAGGSAAAAPGPWRDVLVCAYLGSLGTVVPFSLYLAGVERAGPVRAGLLSTLEPVFGGAAAFLVLGEALTPLQVAGGGVVIAALVLLATRRPSRGTC